MQHYLYTCKPVSRFFFSVTPFIGLPKNVRIRRFVLSWFFFSLMLYAPLVKCQPGTSDPAFNGVDNMNSISIGFLGPAFTTQVVEAIAVQPDGKILVGGNFEIYNGASARGIIRLMPDGLVDTSFHVPYFQNIIVRDIAMQTDGKILLGGGITIAGNNPMRGIVRLLPNGALDPDFNTGSGPSETFPSIANIEVASDGKIYLIGDGFSNFGGHYSPGVVRLLPNGNVDQSFSMGLNAGTTVTSTTGRNQGLAIQPDGKIVVGRTYFLNNVIQRQGLFRLNTDGSLDESFGGATSGNVRIHAIRMLEDNRMLIGGDFTSYRGTAAGYFTRLNTDGSVDNTFNPGGAEANFPVYAIGLQPDGKIMIGGNFTGYNTTTRIKIARLNADGTLDNTFSISSNLVFNTTFITTLHVQSNSAFLFGGVFTDFGTTRVNNIMRLIASGVLDVNFNPLNGISSGEIRQLLRLANGKILAAGNFVYYNKILSNGLAAFDDDGNIDANFNAGKGVDQSIFAVLQQPDGKIIIGGFFTKYNDSLRQYIARIHPDGSLDQSFQIGAGFNSFVQGLALQPDGKIIVSGAFTQYNGIEKSRLCRLNTDGSLDETFPAGTGPNGQVTAVRRLPDGRLLIGGAFTEVNGMLLNRLALLLADGSPDPSFSIGTGFENTVWNVLPANDCIYVTGAFTTYNNAPMRRLAKLDYNGQAATGFNTGTSGPANSDARALYVQPDGKIVVGGGFNLANGTTVAGRIARYNTDGSFDATFNTGSGTGFNSSVFALLASTDTRRVIAGGNFTAHNGTRRGRLARIRVPYTYTLSGSTDCLWSNPDNWPGGHVQREIENGMHIIVNPAACDAIIMDVPVQVRNNGILQVAGAKRLIVL